MKSQQLPHTEAITDHQAPPHKFTGTVAGPISESRRHPHGQAADNAPDAM